MSQDVVASPGRTRIAGLSNDEQCSIALLHEVAAYLKDPEHQKVLPHQRQGVDNLARDLNTFLEIFVKTRERLRKHQLAENKEVPSDSQSSIELPKSVATKNEFNPPPYPPPDPPIIPQLHPMSSFDLSILDVFDAECLPVLPPRRAEVISEFITRNISVDSLFMKPKSLRSTSSSSVSSILEITRRGSDGIYRRVDHDGSKNSSSLSLFGKAKAMLNNTTKRQSSDQLVKDGNDKKHTAPTEGSTSAPGQPHKLRRVRRKISHGDKLALAG